MKKIISVLILVVMTLTLASCSSPSKKIVPDIQKSAQKSNKETTPSNGAGDTPSKDAIGDSVSGNSGNLVPTPTPQVTQAPKTGDIPSTLSNEKISSWQPGTNKEHKVPVLNSKYKTLLDKYDGYYVGDTSQKVIYLTFDEGYENGYTSSILDTLKKCDVKAAFFVTRPYIKSHPELIKRMVAEGHIVGNHTSNHPVLPNISSEKVIDEIKSTADYFEQVTGVKMPGYFRPPEGVWSERTLYITKSLGYKTVLWSMAYMDWDTNKQPGKEAALKFVDTYYHNGAILLLHAVSKSNTEAMEDIINSLKAKGYRFAPLTELGCKQD